MAQPKIKADALDTGSGSSKVMATNSAGELLLDGKLLVNGDIDMGADPVSTIYKDGQSIIAMTSDGIIDANIPAYNGAKSFGHNLIDSSGLSFAYYGGTFHVNGVHADVADGALLMTASSTNYIECSITGIVSTNTTGFTPGAFSLFVVTTDGTSIATVDDRRTSRMYSGVTTINVAGSADVTLTAEQSRCGVLILTGALTGNVNVIVPLNVATYYVHNNTSGAYTVRVKTASGNGYYVPQGLFGELVCDGTNVRKNSTDVNTFDGHYGWQDLRGNFIGSRLGQGTNAPTWTALTDGIYGYTFGATGSDEVWVSFHVPHDYVAGTPIYIHMHWAPSTTDTGIVRWGVEYTVAKGYNQAAFPATTTIYLEQAGSGTNHMHQIVETPLVDAIPASVLEADALILVRVFRDGSHANDTYNDPAFGLECDLHYQSSGTTTKNKNYPFS